MKAELIITYYIILLWQIIRQIDWPMNYDQALQWWQCSNDIIQITLFMKALIKTETKIHRLEFKFFKYIMNVQGKTIYSKTENT